MANQQSANVVSAPFIASQQSISSVMRQVIYALIPCIGVAIYFFGWGIVTNLFIACVSALLWESLALFVRNRPIIMYATDGSAVVTALLLGLAMPPMSPWWLIVVGTFFAIIAAKQLYGGLGYNAINPAMAAYAVLLISFPREMSTWLVPTDLALHQVGFLETITRVLLQQLPPAIELDSMTGATPLDYIRTEIGQGIPYSEIRQSIIFGMFAGRGVEWINIALLSGGIWLWYKKLISWHIPVAVLISLSLCSGVLYLYAPDRYADPMLHLFSGATMMCAFFIATDPVTAATTPLGKFIYGLGIGCIIYIIRTWGGYPDAVAFAVLLMNFTAPLLDQYTVPKVFGDHRRDNLRQG